MHDNEIISCNNSFRENVSEPQWFAKFEPNKKSEPAKSRIGNSGAQLQLKRRKNAIPQPVTDRVRCPS
jgi:hypothetical protein